MKSVIAGNGTTDGVKGADWQLKFNGNLPDYYISEKELAALGWRHGKAPENMRPKKCRQWENAVIEMDIYPKLQAGNGMRQISIITMADGMDTEFCGQTMV